MSDQGGSPELGALLEEMLALRGATAAAVVGADGEALASRGLDRALLERAVGVITSALATGRALGELLADDQDDEDQSDDGPRQLMLMFEEGPILLTPLPGTERVMVLALESERDLGRARLALRGNLRRLAQAVLSA